MNQIKIIMFTSIKSGENEVRMSYCPPLSTFVMFDCSLTEKTKKEKLDKIYGNYEGTISPIDHC
jgi:hypothetical protein